MTFLVVWYNVIGVLWGSVAQPPHHPSWVLEVRHLCGLSTSSSCIWALFAVGRSMGEIYTGQSGTRSGCDHWPPTSALCGGSVVQGPTNFIFNNERLNAFPSRLRTKQTYLVLPLLFNIILVVLASAISQEKGISIQIGKEEINLSLFTNEMIFYVANSKESTIKLI